MKILRICYEWPPPWDGLAPAPYEMSVAQVKLGHEIQVFSGRWPMQGAIEKPTTVKVTGFWREPLKGTVSLTTSVLLIFYYLWWRFRNTPELIHSHGHFAIWIYFYRSLLKKIKPTARELQIPLVVNFHNTVIGRKQAQLDKGEPIKFISKYLAWPLAEYSDRLAVKVADELIFVSQDTKDEAVKYYGAAESKITVVESGVNTVAFSPVNPDERDKTRHDLGFDPHDIIILNHGAMVERKNIHLIVKALAYLPEKYKLLLVGPVPNKEYENKLNDIIFKNGLRERVKMTGYVPYKNVPIAMQAADLFVLPSSFEGVPKVVMQSLACGVPSLVSGFKLTEDIAGLFYLDGLTAQQIATQVDQLMVQRPGVDVQKVRELYSWDNRAQIVEQVYAKIKRSHT